MNGLGGISMMSRGGDARHGDTGKCMHRERRESPRLGMARVRFRSLPHGPHAA